MAENNGATDAELMNTLGRLAGEGRVEVDRKHPPESMQTHLETPAGTIQFERQVDNADRTGADYTQTWNIGQYRLAYSIDKTPGNRTHTVLVKDTDADR